MVPCRGGLRAISFRGLWSRRTGPEAWLRDRDADTTIRNTYQSIVNEPEPPSARPPQGDLFNQGVYGRGGLTLAALRLQLGDKRFFQILRTYADRFRNGNATTADFIAVAEEISGTRLDAFFQGWLYDIEIPAIPALNLTPES